MLPGTRARGFYHTPVTKSILILGGSASLFNILLTSPASRRLLPTYHWLQIIQNAKVWQAISSSFYFSNTRDLLCGSFLIYCFRIFERRLGSRKFSSYVFASTIIAAGLQLVAIYALKHLGHDVGALPSGPYGMIYALLVYYFCDVPSIDAVTLLGVPISGKVLNYSFALQMLLGSRGSLVAGSSGLLAGLIYRYNLGYVQQWLRLPEFVITLCSRTLGRWLEDPPVADAAQTTPMGATLEIQEQMQMELYEQQMWRRATTNNPTHRQRSRSRAAQGYAEVMVPQGGIGGVAEWLWGGNHPDNIVNGPEWHNMNNDNAPQQPTVEVSEDQVQTLVEMGFSRQAVLHALTVTNNDINTATNVLLADAT